MKQRVTKSLAGITLLGVLSATALQSAPAQAATAKHSHSINARQKDQQKRIFDGIHNGSLTNHEAANLENRQDNIDRAQARDHASGDKFTKRERAQIERRENRVSRDIYRQKHDAQHR